MRNILPFNLETDKNWLLTWEISIVKSSPEMECENSECNLKTNLKLPILMEHHERA